MLVVHFTLSYSMNYGIGIDSKNSTNPDWMIIETSSHVNDFANAPHFKVVLILDPKLLERLFEINLFGVEMLKEEVTSFTLLEDLMDRPLKQFLD